MAGESNTFGGHIKLEGEKSYRQAISSINNDLKLLASEMKIVTAQYNTNDKSMEGLTNKNKKLNEQIDNQVQKIMGLSEGLQLAKEQYGDNSSATIKWQTKINEAKAELETLNGELRKNEDALSEAEKAAKENEEEIRKNKNAYSDLNRIISEQTDNLEELKKKYTSVVLEQGKNSKEAKELYGEIGDLNDQLNDNKKRLNEAGKELEKFKDHEDDVGESTLSLGDIIKANLISDAVIGGIKALGSAMKKVGSELIDLGKQAINSYADYEQLFGGVETLFKESAGIVENYANNAYKTAGLSANEYMETVTAFSASLLQSLNNDTKKSAEVADMAITDMADNANKMGTSMESVQNAYQGFAKANYTMLDNLKLGYGGTKGEMERLLADAQKITGIKYDISSFSDIAEAIHVIQTNMEISGLTYEQAMEKVKSGEMTLEEATAKMGTTAKEASLTIQGSISAMKSAWQNMLTGIADKNANFDGLVNNLIDSVGTVAQNLMPVIEVVIDRIVQLIADLPAKLLEYLPNLLETGKELFQNFTNGMAENLPTILSTGKEVLTSFIQGIVSDLPNLVTTVIDLVLSMSDTFVNNIGTIVDMGISIIFALVDGLIQSLPTLIEQVPVLINNFWDAFDENLWKIIKAGGELIVKLGKGLIDNIPVIIANAGEIVLAIVNTILHIDMLNMGKNLIKNLGSGLKSMGGSISTAAKDLLNKLLHPFESTATFKEIGKNMISGIISGLKSMGGALISAGKNAVSSAVNGIKNFLGIHSPSTVFRDQVGKYMALGLSEGFTDEMARVNNDIQSAIPTNFDLGVNTSVSTSSNGDYSTGGIGFNMMVSAFKEALKEVNVMLDDEKVGYFVENVMEGVLV